MQTEHTPNVLNAPRHAIHDAGSDYPTESHIERPRTNGVPSPALIIDGTNKSLSQLALSVHEGWNSLEPVKRESTKGRSLPPYASLNKFGSDIETSSFTSLVIAFMVMSLQIFTKLQKAEMQMALAKLNVMMVTMQMQINQLQQEKASNFTKDLSMAIIETVSSAVSLVGSSVAAVKIGGKISDLQENHAQSEMLASKSRPEAQLAAAETKIANVNSKAASTNLPQDTRQAVTAETKTLQDATAKVSENGKQVTKESPAVKTAQQLANDAITIPKEIELWNSRMQAFSATAAFLKAANPWIQATLGQDATEHQILAREAENTKEITSSLYRQHIEWAQSIRDAISRLLGILQEVQRQDPENALSSSRKMA